MECLLPQVLNEFSTSTGIKVKVIPTDDEWIGVTYPEDEKEVREKLKHS